MYPREILLSFEVLRWPNVSIGLIRAPAILVPIWLDPNIRQTSISLHQMWKYVYACQANCNCYYYPRFLPPRGDVTVYESRQPQSTLSTDTRHPLCLSSYLPVYEGHPYFRKLP